MFKFSANYSNTDHNFVIQNISGRVHKENEYFPYICVLKNILQRGCPTLPSKYIESFIGNCLSEGERIYLIDDNVPNWGNLIKGDQDKGYFPAKEFFYDIIPNDLSEFKFLQQLILPEAYINDVTGINSSEFYDSRVDFYLPQAKLVIEIDGIQHKERDEKFKDEKRDRHLSENGIRTIRISSYDIKTKGIALDICLNEIREQLRIYKNELDNYAKNFFEDTPKSDYIRKSMLATSIMRFQLTVLNLMELGQLNLKDKNWNISLLERDIKGFAEVAIEDIFLWLENICKLGKTEFRRPNVNIEICSSIAELYKGNNSVKIDFSLKKRWTSEAEYYPDVVFVRNDYYGDKNYFRVSTADPIKYKIIEYGDDSDYPELVFILKNLFEFSEFNSGQLPIIVNSLMRSDTIGLLPTGSGKSLCYQFAALLQPCVSFIVVPIKSLMYDQKYNLDKKGIKQTSYISSDQSGEEKGKIQQNFSNGKYLFVWISPERFQTKVFREHLSEINKNLNIGMAVIDEVHCISEWGHDFRTSYLNLSKTIRRYCPIAIFLGLTATASVNVLKDIMIEFEVVRSNVKTLPSFSRPELNFIVLKDDGAEENSKKRELIRIMNGLTKKRDVLSVEGEDTRSGIIFTPFVNGNNGCYKLSNELSYLYNIKVNWYSGDIPKFVNISSDEFNDYKRKLQISFQNNEFPLLVATKAFGMGIDKSNIRYTIHYGIPGSMEALYQEAGRAGRDKKPAACYILYSKENRGNKDIDKIFDLNSTVEEIREISKGLGFDSRDSMRNIFLWLSNRNTLDEDFSCMKALVERFAEPGLSRKLECSKLDMSLSHLQKTLYKLSLIGVVEDWIILDWNQRRGLIEVQFCEYNDDSIMRSLVSYIRKYDKDFEIEQNNKQMNQYQTILKEDIAVYEKASKIILNWQYENISYNRRQSIKNLADLCDNFSDSKQFQDTIEDYFKFTEETYSFDYIAENPRDYDSWFSWFFKDDRESEKLELSELNSLKVNLGRFLESYRYNVGLNFISGMIRLILDEYDDADGKPRLKSAFEQIRAFPESDRDIILKKTLKIGRIYLEKNELEDLSEAIIDSSIIATEEIYKELNDNYSLNHILSGAKNRLNKALEGLI